ncbi:MAG TPA: hypothetical protein VK927_10220 [Adhaeribacter sp.]|nr:hypothetical protein [Adhaeribacter sp.]
MEFKIRTDVAQRFADADKTFDKEMLLKLNPKFPPYKITRFDGLEQGDRVHVEFNFGLFKDGWEYVIAEKMAGENYWSFVDEGVKMPFFLKHWHHRYAIQQEGGQTFVTDTVVFRSPFRLLDYLLYPWLYLHFMYRKPVYKKLFGDPAKPHAK